MPKYLSDTRPEAEAVLHDLLRQAPPWRKLQLVNQLNRQARQMLLAGLRVRHAGVDAAVLDRHLADLLLGPEVTSKLFATLSNDKICPTSEAVMNEEVTQAMLRVVATLEELGIAYVLGGSLASAFYGTLRTTADADLVADIQQAHLSHLLERWQGEFYVSAEAMQEALLQRGSFNLIHLNSFYKVDIFIPKARPFDTIQLENAQRRAISADGSQTVMVATAEDTVLAKLEWYQLGGRLSSQQWQDIVGILQQQRNTLDRQYLQMMAIELAVSDLLDQALAEVGIGTALS